MARWRFVRRALPVLLAAVAVAVALLAAAVGVDADASSEMNVLLDFKGGLQNDSALENWDASTPLCEWVGVICGVEGGVTGLNLSSTDIAGVVGGGICDIPGLEVLHLDDNYLEGGFPEELFNCTNLVSLNFSQNDFAGQLPDGFARLSKLEVLDLSYCNFNGSIPASIGGLPELSFLDLSANGFTDGGIPASFGNLSSVQYLHVAWNYDLEGPFLADFRGLPRLVSFQAQQCLLTGNLSDSIGLLSNLSYFDVSNNSLTGGIPQSIVGLSNLAFFDVADNQLVGGVPTGVSNLKSLTHFFLYNNRLTGPLPSGFGALPKLYSLDVSGNSLEGSIPGDVVNCKQLVFFHIQQNNFSGQIPDGFADLPLLQEFVVFNNQLNGSIPARLGDNANLTRFDVSTNFLSGSIPPNLCNGGVLDELELFSNSFSGSLPDTYGSCNRLRRMRIHNNAFSGPFPLGIWSNPVLEYLEISYNQFAGSIPPEIRKASSLRTVRMNYNMFTGAIPAEISQVDLAVLEASFNQLGGPIPSSIGSMENLTSLLLRANRISGSIPADLGRCYSLASLDLSNNQLSGDVPSSLVELTSLSLLDVSNNRLSGQLPPEFGQGTVISSFNFSYNSFSGSLPPAFWSGAFADSFLGNPGLCGPGLPTQRPCMKSGRNVAVPWVVGGTFIAAAVLFIVSSCWFYRKYSKHQRSVRQRDAGPWRLKSFQKVGFSEADVLASLDEDNVIGEGGAGKVYKASLPDGQVVAVKKLWTNVKGPGTRNDNGFKAEVETLGKIRHRNIVKLLCCCSNKESNLLVYEYMENGSLGELLHSKKSILLDWASRFKIALGSAQGLAYLHHDCIPQILHRDVKSNNILLDEDFEPHVADFGLAKILEKFSRSDSMSIVAGSYGYIAPEYGYTLKVSEKSDIYSFGVVLLELVTGKRPIEPEFGDGVDLVKWVSSKIHSKEGLPDILDPRLGGASQDGMVRVLMLALRCTDPNPAQRPTMQQVVEYLRQADPKQSVKGVKDWKDCEKEFGRTDSTPLDADACLDVKLLVK